MIRKDGFNSCYRVFAVLSEARLESDNIATLAAWSNAFGITETDYLDNRFYTLRMLDLLDREKELARLQVESNLSIASDELEATFQAASNAMDISYLGNPWSGSKRHLTDEMLRNLRVFSRKLPEDSEMVNEYELRQVRYELEKFAKHVQENIEDSDLKAFLLEQITIIRKAFLEYHVIGVKAFRDASGNFFTEAQNPVNRKVVEDNKNSEELKKLKSLWTMCLQLYATYNALESTGAKQAIESGVEVVRDFFL